MIHKPRPILLFNPALRNREHSPSHNLGDLIIERAVKRELSRLYQDEECRHIASHDYPGIRDLANCLFAKERFFGGTNILTGRLHSYYQLWKLASWQRPFVKNVVLLAAGWMYYEPEEPPEAKSVEFWHSVLSHRRIHSVRDEYSRRRLVELGIKNVVNTSCVTLWPFLEPDAPKIPAKKSENCLVMLTDWLSDHQHDRDLLRLLESNYQQTYFWPQGKDDLKLYGELGGTGKVIEGGLLGLEQMLQSDMNFDYVGSRLHGGIFCQLHGRRGLILAVDNRALEIGSDTGLPVVQRGDLEAVRDWINHPRPFSLRLPRNSIQSWRDQFAEVKRRIA